nr:ribonuclease H-like domain, reverse transcriptase, RNA-dependent DNA polymerase [Tanacetum cinerariifolium]
MSAMGELNFFLGLHVLHKKDGIFLSQDKYVGDILKKFGYSDVRSANTPMDKENLWGKDGPGKDVELHLYRSMIGSLMNFTASRPDIMFVVKQAMRGSVEGNHIICTTVEQQSPHHDTSSSLHPSASTEPTPTTTATEIPTLRKYSRRATRIAQSKALSTAADEPASLLRDDSQGEAFSTVTSLDAGQDRENIIKTSAFPHESTPMVTSLDADEGSMQQQLQELMAFCICLQRQQTEMASKIKAQDLEIYSLKARVKLLEDKDRGSVEPSGDDAPIKGRTKDKGKEKVVESEEPKKKKLQEQIDAQVAKEIEQEIAREDQMMNEQLARDAEIARLHAKES